MRLRDIATDERSIGTGLGLLRVAALPLACALALATPASSQSSDPANQPAFRIISSSQAGGGGRSQGGNFLLEGSIGQTAADSMSGGSFLVQSGFGPMCPLDCELGDIDCDGSVSGGDLGIVLLLFGPCPDPFSCVGDLDNNGEVDGGDLGLLLLSWH